MTPEKLYEVLSAYAGSQGIRLNKDKPFVMDIMQGLLTNEAPAPAVLPGV